MNIREHAGNEPASCKASHRIAEKENPGALAGATEVKASIETGEFPEHDSPVWAGAPAIILRHFCGVAV